VLRMTERHRWLMVAGLAGLLATRVAGEAVSASWRLASGEEPPEDPTVRDIDWRAALLFSAAAGALVGMTELVARRAAGNAWKKTTGKRPPRQSKDRQKRR
jgi:hypothetical protein